MMDSHAAWRKFLKMTIRTTGSPIFWCLGTIRAAVSWRRLATRVTLLGLGSLTVLSVEAATISVQADKPGHRISPTLWGIFFEDINLSADGGIYPELVRNRSFEDGEQLESWNFRSTSIGKSEAAIDTSRPLNPLNLRSLRIKLDGTASLINEGYWGMNIVKGDGYTLKLAARATDGFNEPIAVKILRAGKELANGEIKGVTEDWKYYTLDLTAAGSDPKAVLQINL